MGGRNAVRRDRHALGDHRRDGLAPLAAGALDWVAQDRAVFVMYRAGAAVAGVDHVGRERAVDLFDSVRSGRGRVASRSWPASYPVLTPRLSGEAVYPPRALCYPSVARVRVASEVA